MRNRNAAIKMPDVLPGLPRPRMDAGAPSLTEIAAKFEGLNRSFDAFKAQNDKNLAELKAGREDVVTREHTDRINNTVSELQAELTALNRRMQLANIANDNAATTPEKAAYRKAFASFIRKGEERVTNLRELAVQAAMTTDSDPDGGFTVSEEMDKAIQRVALTVSSMRSISDVITINGPGIKFIHNLGGASRGWVGEKESRPQTTTPQLAAIEITAHELYANPAISGIALDDAGVDIEGLLGEEVAFAFADEEGLAFVSGDGVNKPRGFLSYSTVANASWAWGKVGFIKTGANGAFGSGTPTADSVIDLFYALKASYRGNAVFMANDATIGALRKLKDGNGNYLWQPTLTPGTPSTVLEKAIISDDNMPAMSTNGIAMAFGDFKRGYKIVDRAGTRVLRDPYTAKPNVLFYTTKRVGGGIRDYQAIKLLQFSA